MLLCIWIEKRTLVIEGSFHVTFYEYNCFYHLQAYDCEEVNINTLESNLIPNSEASQENTEQRVMIHSKICERVENATRSPRNQI